MWPGRHVQVYVHSMYVCVGRLYVQCTYGFVTCFSLSLSPLHSTHHLFHATKTHSIVKQVHICFNLRYICIYTCVCFRCLCMHVLANARDDYYCLFVQLLMVCMMYAI